MAAKSQNASTAETNLTHTLTLSATATAYFDTSQRKKNTNTKIPLNTQKTAKSEYDSPPPQIVICHETLLAHLCPVLHCPPDCAVQHGTGRVRGGQSSKLGSSSSLLSANLYRLNDGQCLLATLLQYHNAVES